jgi:tetratricopeptide (TPR) repeat protein
MKILNYELPNMEQTIKLAQSIKGAAITVMAAGAAAIGGVGTYNAVTSDTVIVEPLRVPKVFEEMGFSSEVTTARLLDEVTTLGRTQSSSAKERVSVLSKSKENDLERLSLKGADTKTVQNTIQETLGIQKQRITGEITYSQDADDASPAGRTYHVRLRKLPSNNTLLDMTAKGEPQAVLQQAALGMIEVFDPHIAASIYWRAKDETNALRMIDVVLNNDDPADDKFSLNLRGYIHVTHKELDEAWSMFERIQKIDPNFAPQYNLASMVYLERKQFPESIAAADKIMALAPDKYWGAFAKAKAMRESKQSEQALALFRQTLTFKPDAPAPYVQAANFFNAQKLPDEALNTAKRGLQLYPQNEALQKLVSDLQAPKSQEPKPEK